MTTTPQQRWIDKNRDRVNAAQRARYAANREARLRKQAEYNAANAEKISARRKAAYAADPEKFKFKTLKSRHGLTHDEYLTILNDQGGGCAVCGSVIPDITGHASLFHVDHDHAHCPKNRSCSTCRRGLLCAGCNLGIGHLRDSPTLLREAAGYLEGSRSRIVTEVKDTITIIPGR